MGHDAPPSIPEWLMTPDLDPQASYRAERARHSLEQVQFEHAFEAIMDTVAGGATLDNAVKDYPVTLDRSRFNAWVQRNAERRSTYELAKTYRSEVWAGRMLDVAAGTVMQGGLPREVARDTLEVNTLKWLIGADNRKVYGDVKQVDVTGGISIRAIFDDMEKRQQAIPLLLSQTIDGAVEGTVGEAIGEFSLPSSGTIGQHIEESD